MRFKAQLGRLAAVLGATAALGATLMVGGSTAQASVNEPARVEKIFLIQPDGSAVEAAPGFDTRAAVLPYARVIYPAVLSDCNAREMCIWRNDHYTGWGVFMGGDYAWCQGWRFEGTLFQDHTWSIWNSVTGGPSSIWNRYSDGTYRYHKYGLLQPGYRHDTQFSHIMDAWAFDPANNCTSLNLAHLTYPPA